LLKTPFLLSIVFVASLFCSMVPSVRAASNWSQTYGGTGTDVAFSIITTLDGGYAIAGYTTSFGINGFEFWLVKTDSNGVMQWDKTYGRGGPQWESNEAYSVIATLDGGYAIAGYTWSYGAGMADYWLIKTDSLGNVQWTQTYGGDNVDKAETVVATPDGGYILVGIQWSFDPTGVWLVKTDASGNMQWNKTYEGLSATDARRSVILTSDGGYAIAGTKTEINVNDVFLLLKTDALGNMLWNKTYGGTTREIPHSLIAAFDGGYVIAGEISYPNPSNWCDFWLVKTDSLGIIPDFVSWIGPTMLLVAATPILFYKKRLLSKRS
jgi:hypothetical protein